MRWNRLNIEVDFDRFFNEYCIIQIIPADEKKAYNVTDFHRTSEKYKKYVESICYFRTSDGQNYVFALIKNENQKFFNDMSMFYPILLLDYLAIRINSESDRNRLIAQLALNKCVNFNPYWGNISGFCYVNVTKDFDEAEENQQQIFLDFRINKNLFLTINIKTYSKTCTYRGKIEKILKKIPYVIDEKEDLKFRRGIPNKDNLDDKNTYRFFSNKKFNKNTMPFLKLKSSDYFKSKLNYLHHLMLKLKYDELYTQKILSVKFENINFNTIQLSASKKKKSVIKLNVDLVQQFQLFIEEGCEKISQNFDDALSTFKSNYIKSDNSLFPSSFSYIKINKLEEANPNIPIIMILHEEDYYKRNKVQDNYRQSNKYTIQHISYEALLSKKRSKSVMQKSLQELALKTSINFKKNPVISMNNNENDFVFALPFETYILDDDHKRKNPTLHFAVCNADNNNFSYHIAKNEEYNLLSNIFSKLSSPLDLGQYFDICCLYWKKATPQSVHSILQVKDAIQMPNFEIIYDLCKHQKESTNNFIPLSKAKEMFKLFLSEKGFIQKEDFVNQHLEKWSEFGQIKINNFKSIIKEMQQNHKNKFIDYSDFFLWSLNKNNPFHDIPIPISGWRDEKLLPLLELPYNLGYGKITFPFLSKELPAYFAGYNTGYNTFGDHHALSIRVIYSLTPNDNHCFEQLIPMLDTNFIIPFEALSVLPYPIKLLREFAEMQANNDEIDFDCYSFKSKKNKDVKE